MKPAPFDYCAPTSVEEACSLLSQYGDDAKIPAGGQSLVPMGPFTLMGTGGSRAATMPNKYGCAC